MRKQLIKNFDVYLFETFNELNSASCLENDLSSEILYFRNSEKGTNELTGEEKISNSKEIPYIKSDKEKIIIDIKMDESNKVKNNKQKNLGRKRKGVSNKKCRHTKFSDDNTRRKIKRIIISELQDYINKKIKVIFENETGNGLIEKKLMKLAQDQISEAGVEFDQQFLYKKLKDIFSEKVTSRITNYTPDRNKEVIDELLNDENEERRNFFKGLFDITFGDCIKYFRGDYLYNEYLQGLKKFSDIQEQMEKDQGIMFTKHFIKYLYNYEKIINNKRPRKNKK
jgi:hypothetical protein